MISALVGWIACIAAWLLILLTRDWPVVRRVPAAARLLASTLVEKISATGTWVYAVSSVIAVIALGYLDTRSVEPPSDVSFLGQPPAEDAPIEPESAAREPPPDPVPPSAAKIADARERESRILNDRNYTALWKDDESARQVLSAFSLILETSEGSQAKVGQTLASVLQQKQLMNIVLELSAYHARTGALPDDVKTKLSDYLSRESERPNRGTWNAPADHSDLGYDLSALAAWFFRTNPDYMREFIRAKTVMRSWPRVRHPLFERFSSEKRALTWLSTFTTLTTEERIRLEKLNASPLGDDFAEQVSVADLVSEYDDNEIRADGRFKDHVVELTGTVGVVKRDLTDTIYITIGTGKHDEQLYAQCFFNDSSAIEAARLRGGDRITIRGRVGGLMMSIVYLRDCEFL